MSDWADLRARQFFDGITLEINGVKRPLLDLFDSKNVLLVTDYLAKSFREVWEHGRSQAK